MEKKDRLLRARLFVLFGQYDRLFEQRNGLIDPTGLTCLAFRQDTPLPFPFHLMLNLPSRDCFLLHRAEATCTTIYIYIYTHTHLVLFCCPPSFQRCCFVSPMLIELLMFCRISFSFSFLAYRYPPLHDAWSPAMRPASIARKGTLVSRVLRS